jgi:hypothetical protein
VVLIAIDQTLKSLYLNGGVGTFWLLALLQAGAGSAVGMSLFSFSVAERIGCKVCVVSLPEHDAKSVGGDIVSAKPVDDKPVVLVSDKPVEVKPHIDEGKDMSACIPCVPLPVRVDMGVQTDDGGVDHVPVHIVSQVVSQSFVRTPQKRFVGATIRVHKGKDGRVRQLCGPGITTLQGHAKKVHVQQRKVLARIDKKVEAPKYKFIWRKKEVRPPRAVSSRAGQEGGCGEVGKQDLKTVNMRGAIVYIPPPFRADPHMLGTMLFEGGRMIWARRRR